jgi:AP-3 complex subunit sigma
MILGVLVFNSHGKSRLVRWYDTRLQNLPFSQKRSIVWKCYRAASTRNAGSNNFLFSTDSEISEILAFPLKSVEPAGLGRTSGGNSDAASVGHDRPRRDASDRPDTQLYGRDLRVVFRHYATLFFVFIVDENENELGILDLIQVFVETLDRYFGNVCELDIVFHHEKVNYVLDELISGGLVLETNQADILSALHGISEAITAENTGQGLTSLARKMRR